MKTLQQWLSMIESQHPVEIELGLARVAQVAKNLGIAPNTAKVVTVAGTNGKGSTCQMLQAILLEQGLKCGVYSSPHFLHYNERIQVNGAFASDEVIINAFTAIDQYDFAIQALETGSKLLRGIEQPFDYELANLYFKKGDKPRMIAAFLDYLQADSRNRGTVEASLQRNLSDVKEYEELQNQLYARIQRQPNNED